MQCQYCRTTTTYSDICNDCQEAINPREDCPKCNGKGHNIEGRTCELCEGEGEVHHESIL